MRQRLDTNGDELLQLSRNQSDHNQGPTPLTALYGKMQKRCVKQKGDSHWGLYIKYTSEFLERGNSQNGGGEGLIGRHPIILPGRKARHS